MIYIFQLIFISQIKLLQYHIFTTHCWYWHRTLNHGWALNFAHFNYSSNDFSEESNISIGIHWCTYIYIICFCEKIAHFLGKCSGSGVLTEIQSLILNAFSHILLVYFQFVIENTKAARICIFYSRLDVRVVFFFVPLRRQRGKGSLSPCPPPRFFFPMS